MVDECAGKGLEEISNGLLQLLSRNLAGNTEGNYEEPQSGQLVSYLRFELGTS
jgi:hypothetical protein